MLGLGFAEIVIVLLIILVLFGPKELPKLARLIARFIYQIKNIFKRLEEEWNLSTELNPEPNSNPKQDTLDE